MKIVVLDGYTLNPGDNPWDPLAALGELTVYDRTIMPAIVLSQADVEAQAYALYAEGDAVRAQHPLLAQRHDVIVEGALILLYIMRGMGIHTLHVSDADGMEGYRAYLSQRKA